MIAGVITITVTVAFLAVMRMVMPHHRRATPRVSWRGVAKEPTSAGERLAWFGGACNRPLATGALALAVALAAAGLLVGVDLLALLALPLALAAAELSRVRVTASGEGVQIGFGVSGLLAQRLDLARIQYARAGRVETLGLTGYGLQDDGNGVRLLVGPGECLGLELDDRTSWIVSTRSAETAARIVNALLVQPRG